MNDELIEFTAIGMIETNYRTPEDMPIQGPMKSDTTGRVTVFPEYADGLRDLEGFSHLILIYVFHESTDEHDLEVEPFLENKSRGVFATRAPRRPNPVGMTVVQLENVQDNNLTIRGIDILDRTPLLDIKPYIPDVDSHEQAKDGWIDGRMSEEHRSDNRFL